MELILVILAAVLIVPLIVVMAVLVVLVIRERQKVTLIEAELRRLEEVADQALAKAQEWASAYLKREEKRMRADAITKSEAVVKGKVAEQLVPFTQGFGYNPRDCRFLGSPLDFIVFEGLTEGELESIIFIEVKTGLSRLSKREQQVRNIIDAGEVYYTIIHVGGKDEIS